MSIQFVSVADLKALLEISDSDRDSLLTTIIQLTSAEMESYLNLQLKKQERTMKFNGGRTIYFLPAYPVDLTQDFTVTVAGAAMIKDSDYYVLDDIGIVRFIYSPLDFPPWAVSITWTGGYVESTGNEKVLAVPDKLKKACLYQCRYEFTRRRDWGLQSESLPSGNVNIYKPADFLPDVKAILDSMRAFPTER